MLFRSRLLDLQNASANAMAAADRASAEARRRGQLIPFGQPIHVGHHSERADRRFRAGIGSLYGKSYELSQKAQHLASKAESVGTGGISSDDPDAIQKLKKQLAEATAEQERMKAANKAIRSGKTHDAKVANLAKLGYSEAAAVALITPDFCGRVGYPQYKLSNNNANIKRITGRIEELERRRGRESVEIQGTGYVYREDVEENRVMFIFDGKPSPDVIAILKRNAFKWARSRGAWQRQDSANGRYAAKVVRQALEAMATE